MEQKDPDVELMLAFCAGEEAAFDQLFRRWAGPLLRYLERMLGDGALAEELVQEAFLRVHGARDRYEPRARFSTWRELNHLPERQRIALWLSAAEGHSYAEVAAILETTETSVKALVHRGRSALVARMGDCVESLTSFSRQGTA